MASCSPPRHWRSWKSGDPFAVQGWPTWRRRSTLPSPAWPVFRLRDSVLLRARQVGNDALGSLDAIHLASALAVGADSILTCHDRLADSAASLGLTVLAPR